MNEQNKHMYLEHLWDRVLLTGRNDELAQYIEAGGEITSGVREYLVSVLRGKQSVKDKKGRKEPVDMWRDVQIYFEVEKRRKEITLEENTQVSVRAACDAVSDDTDVPTDTVLKQHERGSEILIENGYPIDK